jgi:transcriptional regulator with XRE-family HTH domain
MKFADMVREARNKAHLSQIKLGKQMCTDKKPQGVWSTYIGQIEKGEKVPADEICIKLAEVLELDPEVMLLAAYEARAESEVAGELFRMMKRSLADPVIRRLLSSEKPLSPALLESLADPDLREALGQENWRQAFIRAYRVRKKRDIPGLLARTEAMNDKQWSGLMTILDGMGL